MFVCLLWWYEMTTGPLKTGLMLSLQCVKPVLWTISRLSLQCFDSTRTSQWARASMSSALESPQRTTTPPMSTAAISLWFQCANCKQLISVLRNFLAKDLENHSVYNVKFAPHKFILRSLAANGDARPTGAKASGTGPPPRGPPLKRGPPSEPSVRGSGDTDGDFELSALVQTLLLLGTPADPRTPLEVAGTPCPAVLWKELAS